MLQMEKSKAVKKIAETRKRTEQIRTLKMQNDFKYQQDVMSEQHRDKLKLSTPSNLKMLERKAIDQEIQEKKYRIFLEKKKDVENFKRESIKHKEMARKYKEQSQRVNFERMLVIRD